MNSNQFSLKRNQRGNITELKISGDDSKMNWVIDPAYLATLGYEDQDKLFGEFTVTIDGQTYNSIDFTPMIMEDERNLTVRYQINEVDFHWTYASTPNGLVWNLEVKNEANQVKMINNLGVWASLAYVMFRDTDVHRNANQSAAVFPSISRSFTKLAAVRRDNTAPNLGMFQTKGEVLSVGTYNEYRNRFFENVSPSLDGLLFHQIILAGGYPQGNGPKNDWIYDQSALRLDAGQENAWEFTLAPFTDQNDFYQVAASLGQPVVHALPMVVAGQDQIVTVNKTSLEVVKIVDVTMTDGELHVRDLTDLLEAGELHYVPDQLGEHKIEITFNDGKQDMLVFNKMASIKELLRNRAEYVSEHSYAGATGAHPYSFGPISNQGESLGKMTFILQECLLDPEVKQVAHNIQQVEESAVKYVRPKWFVDGEFKQPRKLYGDFYRVMDLEYIGHLFYLLSQCDASQLQLNSPETYLTWAAEVVDVRVNPDLHDNERGKSEAQMLGQYFLYVEDLLADLKKHHLDQEYEEISKSWQTATKRIAAESESLSAAMTEHFFDNAGFGPAAGALALAGQKDASKVYGELLKANIGFSNDFRAQSPDRWWEALSYMIHALWGGVTAASAMIAGRELSDVELVQAAYRGTIAVLYMYDSNATATDRPLTPGEAASTYSIAGPNLNRPDLSRNRFGQSVFASDGGIFTRLFPDGYTGEDDWDMGEELVAYLNGFGQETYVYEVDGKLRAVNGQVAAVSGETYEVTSFAPYPTRWIDLTTGERVELAQQKVTFDLQTHEFK